MNNYVTLLGDTWDAISFKIYGTEAHMSLLMNANPAYIKTVVFSANVRLIIPTIPDQIPSTLPPWKRGG
ncbi:phage tail protein [Brevibacillus sp. HB1.1]|uniref:tail protein X n=1 Tax=Brevibacillus sp. HB1.1 TaxID=2738808 RepID=UPI001576B0C8|nr:tail protein X [Brevibacillus sp. HB1.1]NTU28847.1 phage tail protein [Brevibacillus sp. HB1.1]